MCEGYCSLPPVKKSAETWIVFVQSHKIKYHKTPSGTVIAHFTHTLRHISPLISSYQLIFLPVAALFSFILFFFLFFQSRAGFILHVFLAVLTCTAQCLFEKAMCQQEASSWPQCPSVSQLALLSSCLRLSLLEEWRGVRDEALSKLSGIKDCIFVHAGGFIGGNKTQEGALEMARRTLQAAAKSPANGSSWRVREDSQLHISFSGQSLERICWFSSLQLVYPSQG